jgi:hypothetical protein
MNQLKNEPVMLLITENKKQPEEMAGRIVMVETPASEPFWRFWK